MRTAEPGVGCSQVWRRRAAVASGALSRLCCPCRQGTGRLLRFTSKNKHVPQAAPVPCRAAPRPPAPPPPGQSRLCARPATPAAQAILISVWVCAGRWESKPAFFQRPDPDPRLLLPGSPGLCVPLLAATGSGALPEPPPRVRISPFTEEGSGACCRRSEPRFPHIIP